MMNFTDELRWRGMLHDMMPGIEEELSKEMASAYIGFDPTADSLHIGHLVSVMTLLHFQRAGHQPIALIGGATGMIGDPSFKSAERNLLDRETIEKNIAGIKKQLSQFLDFNTTQANRAELVNNYDWMKDFSFIDFIRDVGKHITVNYMMAKDSVKKRLEGGTGMSFTEFSYQLIQGYDFYYLWKHKNCKIQLGGSDQWGNIVTGTELIRRMGGGEAFAMTTPLIKKADGTKFGKTEGGNIWLDPQKTSPYQFYQFWLNVSDEDCHNFIRIFSLKNQAAIEVLEAEHAPAPHTRVLQKALAEEITERVHGKEALENAMQASEILFGNGTDAHLKALDNQTLLDVFAGVPQFEVSRDLFTASLPMIELVAGHTQIFPSKGEARKMLQANGVAMNKTKIALETEVTTTDLINNQYLLIQKGKKNYYLIKVID